MIPWATEAMFQVLSAIDAGQTASIHLHRGTYELASPLDARWAIGREPSTRDALLYKAAEGLLHIVVTWALQDHRKLEISWEAVTIAGQGYTDARNLAIGLTLHY